MKKLKNGKLVTIITSFYDFLTNKEVQTFFTVLICVCFLFPTNSILTRIFGFVLGFLVVLACACMMIIPFPNIKGIKHEYVKIYSLIQGLILFPVGIGIIIVSVGTATLDARIATIFAASFIASFILRIIYKKKSGS